MEDILAAAKQAGAGSAGYVLLRLPHEVKILFREWLDEHYPDRAKHVMSLINQARGGKDYDAEFGPRMSRHRALRRIAAHALRAGAAQVRVRWRARAARPAHGSIPPTGARPSAADPRVLASRPAVAPVSGDWRRPSQT